MQGERVTDLDHALCAFVRDRRVPIFAIVPAEMMGEEREGWRPADIFPGCRSIVLAGVPFVPFPYRVDPETNVADQAWWDANEPAFNAINRVREELQPFSSDQVTGWPLGANIVTRQSPSFSHIAVSRQRRGSLGKVWCHDPPGLRR